MVGSWIDPEDDCSGGARYQALGPVNGLRGEQDDVA